MRRLAPMLMLLLLAACSSDEETSAPDRLVALGRDGNIYTMAADGSDLIALTSDAGPERSYSQPTWAPGGWRVAWVETASDQEPGIFAAAAAHRQAVPAVLHVAAGDGSEGTTTTVPFAPFYLYWSPDGSRLALLGNATDRLGLAIWEDGGVRSVDAGQPYYFSWGPDSDRLLLHVGADRLEYFTLDGEASPLPADPGLFAAPEWSDDGSLLVYVIVDGDRQHLVRAGPDGIVESSLEIGAGAVSFLLSPDGEAIAYVGVGDGGGAGPLRVDTEGEQSTAIDDPVAAFFWDPAGNRLAALTLPEPGALNLVVTGGAETTDLGRFLPSGTLLQNYLPFFTQYAQSHSFFSGDGTRFVMAGSRGDGDGGVWVFPIDGSDPSLVFDGVFAAFPPPG